MRKQHRDSGPTGPEMLAIEPFFLFAALVVAIGLAVRWRDRRSGRALDAEPEDPSPPMRERFADTGFLPDDEWRTRNARSRPVARRRQGAAPGTRD